MKFHGLVLLFFSVCALSFPGAAVSAPNPEEFLIDFLHDSNFPANREIEGAVRQRALADTVYLNLLRDGLEAQANARLIELCIPPLTQALNSNTLNLRDWISTFKWVQDVMSREGAPHSELNTLQELVLAVGRQLRITDPFTFEHNVQPSILSVLGDDGLFQSWTQMSDEAILVFFESVHENNPSSELWIALTNRYATWLAKNDAIPSRRFFTKYFEFLDGVELLRNELTNDGTVNEKKSGWRAGKNSKLLVDHSFRPILLNLAEGWKSLTPNEREALIVLPARAPTLAKFYSRMVIEGCSWQEANILATAFEKIEASKKPNFSGSFTLSELFLPVLNGKNIGELPKATPGTIDHWILESILQNQNLGIELANRLLESGDPAFANRLEAFFLHEFLLEIFRVSETGLPTGNHPLSEEVLVKHLQYRRFLNLYLKNAAKAKIETLQNILWLAHPEGLRMLSEVLQDHFNPYHPIIARIEAILVSDQILEDYDDPELRNTLYDYFDAIIKKRRLMSLLERDLFLVNILTEMKVGRHLDPEAESILQQLTSLFDLIEIESQSATAEEVSRNLRISGNLIRQIAFFNPVAWPQVSRLIKFQLSETIGALARGKGTHQLLEDYENFVDWVRSRFSESAFLLEQPEYRNLLQRYNAYFPEVPMISAACLESLHRKPINFPPPGTKHIDPSRN